MSMPEQTVDLPSTFLGNNRSFTMGFSFHGDIQLQVRDSDGTPKDFGLAHGNEALLVAATMGYYTRLGIARTAIRAMLTDAARDILAANPSSQWLNRPASHVMATAENEPLTRFDLPGGLHCLAPQVPAHPGTTERTVSTGFYTRLHESGDTVMVLAALPPHRFGETVPADQLTQAELCGADIPPVVQTICQLAMGEYRTDIAALLHAYNGDLADNF